MAKIEVKFQKVYIRFVVLSMFKYYKNPFVLPPTE